MAVADRVSPHRWPLSWLSEQWVDHVSLFASAGVLLLFAFFALWPQAVTTYNPTLNSLSSRHKPPGFVNKKGGVHTLGTDHMGRDIWSRLVWGARASLTVGGLGLAIGGSFGVLIGLLAGYRGGWFDRISMRIVDAYLIFPIF